MIRSVHGLCLLMVVLAWGLCRTTAGWEIELQSEASTRAAVVRLGDISRINGLAASDAQLLEQIVVAPGPNPSYSRSLSASQLRKILLGRGVEMDACHVVGALRAVITFDPAAHTEAAVASSSASVESVPPRERVLATSYRSRGGMTVVEGVEKKIARAVGQQLMQLSGESVPWDVEVSLSGPALRGLPETWTDLAIEGLQNASEGRHQLIVCLRTDGGDIRLPLQVSATRMVEAVVPRRPLPRGEVIGVSDVDLRYVSGPVDLQQVARTIDSVVGHQAQLPLRAGEPVPLSSLKRPVLVQRREEIEVVARRAGITIKTKVRALDEGTLGDIISVEKLDGSKDRFVVRVVGVQQAEVCVSSAVVQSIPRR